MIIRKPGFLSALQDSAVAGGSPLVAPVVRFVLIAPGGGYRGDRSDGGYRGDRG